MEEGVRIRFVPVRRDRRPNRYDEMDRLVHWCRVFADEGMAPVEGGASAGNLSFRTTNGFVITATRTMLKSELAWDRFVEVVRSNWLDYEMHYLGVDPPSSDSFLHERIYRHRPDVRAVFHGHDPVILAAADRLPGAIVTPREIPFGTREDADETARMLGSGNFLIRKGHGFLSVGATLDEAGETAVRYRRLASSSSQNSSVRELNTQ